MTGKNIALWEVFVFGFMFHPEGAKVFEVPIRDPTIAGPMAMKTGNPENNAVELKLKTMAH